MADSPTTSPLDADDPRISEWIDGRLPQAESAEIRQAVAASPELTRLVEDLRAIRLAMRASAGDGPRVDLGDRIMAAIASSNDNGQGAAAASRMTAHAPSGGRSLPWLGLAGALAAGVLVTVVLNLPKENGREVALAPETEKKLEAMTRMDSRPVFRARRQADRSIADFETKGRLERVDDAGGFGQELALKRELDGARDELASDDAPPMDALAAAASPGDPGEALSESAERLRESNAVSAPTFAKGGRGEAPQGAAAPAPSAVAPPSTPTVVSSSNEELKESDSRMTFSDLKATAPPGASESRQLGKHAAEKKKVDLAGVLVIAVTSPSERRALDRLVADSGLQATPLKDHLELVGTATAVDGFLRELTRVGLVTAVPGRRAEAAGKRKDAEKNGADQTTLILRVVERKAKQPAEPQAVEGEAKP